MEGATPGKIHRALAEKHREQLVDELRRAPRGLDVQELAQRLELHHNTIRWHLGVLADAAIVDSRPESRGAPGRPRIVYTLRAGSDAADSRSYRLLATILAGALAELEDGSDRAEAAGRAWGRYLVERLPPQQRGDETAAVARVVDLLAEQGFRPETVGREIRMHHCPYREIAPGLVCSTHAGLIAGALSELGSRLELEGLDPFVEPELCIARLGHRKIAGDAGG